MNIGYARVSTAEQNLDLQLDALKAAGCERVVEDTASGGKAQRPGLDRLREQLRRGDVLVVWRLDRLGRSLRHLIELMAELEGQGVGFRSVTESIDTTTPGGKLVFHVFGALAEFERNLIRERTRAGLEAARARGRKGGRRRKLDDRKASLAVDLYRQKRHPIGEICRAVGISKPTLYAYVRQADGDAGWAPGGVRPPDAGVIGRGASRDGMDGGPLHPPSTPGSANMSGTGKKAASAAGKVLSSPKSSKAAETAAASDLSQARRGNKKK